MPTPYKAPTSAQADASYHPHGFDESASLRRARRPYIIRNVLTGGAIVAFIVGVYAYSISAVKQDDFSDVVDLLPPEAERAAIRSIEDEAREKALASEPAVAVAEIEAAAPTPAPSSVLSYLSPKRLSEVDWLKNRGWVEHGKDNLLVWGAPSVDKIGSMKDTKDASAKRQV
ncbi:Cytochrome c oxidase assembly factor 3, mitochondrial [Vanrija pseudolonga]|uniref:Cytochrome c oxidase assembly factor 3 n=1 Tax=Vanrija pseudolonga TaxID=143232 RepID=A0AAF0Y8G8_9TREE|nr:Cytochrome c oxidase assembly factor 3, mitochondrial [Vanrija pseudolonga]